MTSSVGGLRGARHIGHYIAAKHGVIGLMRTLALELGDKRIRVNTLCPTNVGTPMLLNDETYRLFLPDLPNPTKEDFAKVAQTGQILPTPWSSQRTSARRHCFSRPTMLASSPASPYPSTLDRCSDRDLQSRGTPNAPTRSTPRRVVIGR